MMKTLKKIGQFIVVINLFVVLPILGSYTGDNLLMFFIVGAMLLAVTCVIAHACDMFYK